MRMRLLVAVSAVALALPLAGGAVAGDVAIFDGPRVEQAKRIASNLADSRYGLSYPPADWTAICYRESGRKLQCPVKTDDNRCVGGMDLVRRDGRWRARNKEMSCG
jgi:hypothetical protein